jgi:hypothetical protein
MQNSTETDQIISVVRQVISKHTEHSLPLNVDVSEEICLNIDRSALMRVQGGGYSDIKIRTAVPTAGFPEYEWVFTAPSEAMGMSIVAIYLEPVTMHCRATIAFSNGI